MRKSLIGIHVPCIDKFFFFSKIHSEAYWIWKVSFSGHEMQSQIEAEEMSATACGKRADREEKAKGKSTEEDGTSLEPELADMD